MTDRLRPVMFRWDRASRSMVPHGRFFQLCDRQFVDGEDYALGPVDGVSTKSRAHLFVSINEVWASLPEKEERWPTPEHLRKWALVQVGHCTVTDYALETAVDARRTALALRKADEYAVIIVRGNVVKFCSAKSTGGQIKHEEFQAVKDKVLNKLAELVGSSKAEIEKHTNDGGAL